MIVFLVGVKLKRIKILFWEDEFINLGDKYFNLRDKFIKYIYLKKNFKK